ncbi:molybdopterin oxidoreductase family protein [Planctomicrobium piriforme]|uniref:Assimilatory nitrate reductase catalytic subunit n=1 Tax=Planctomicrobium piriforme TaxID=1576369 RepID=A0A1I3QHQ0_9PLAN|nr:nitrate reductase [Planctomicrobium piriforme]SFJ32857.1 assimilatory nitrate reductase catalytic subunit [Planctomicrobium piriforme]
MSHYLDILTSLPGLSILRQRDGHLTRELLQEPGGFGLGQIPARLKPEATTNMVCGFCSTGCGLKIHLRAGEAIGLSPQTSYPVNLGMACPKGWEALTVLDAPDRATTPLLRNASGQLEPVSWETAMQQFVGRMKSIQKEHGPHSVAFLSTGQIPTEEMALLGSLAKFGMGMLHGDGNTRQCMATAAVAYKQSFGFDAPPYTYADFEESDALVFVGSNPCIAHPIMWERVMRNRRSPEIIVIDPRMTETAMYASQHLAIKPKSDQSLLYGVARILIENGWLDESFIAASTEGFEEFARYVAAFDLPRVVSDTGLKPEQIERFAETIHQRKRASFWWTMGVNQSYQGTRTAQAIINLALMTGNIGKPGTGANSITGQCNAMGSRLFSNTTGLLGGRDFTKPEHRQQIADVLEIDAARIPTENSWAYHEIMEGILKGKIKGLWVICTNTAHSWINQNLAREMLDRLDFLVVQDMYHTTETARLAHLVLPAAGWGEKEGTFINSERRFGVIKKVRKAPGQALADFHIFKLIAHYWGCGDMFSMWTSPAAVFEIIKECSRGMPCDFTGMQDYGWLDAQGGVQWPCPSELEAPAQERRLFEDGKFFRENGKAMFYFEEPRPLSEPTNDGYPFILLTGRGTASQWHTQTRTGKSAVLRKLYPEKPFVEINPADARTLGLVQNEWITIESQRGRMLAMALFTPAVQPGQLFIPMHYEGTNQLTDAVFDPYSKQPSYKACAVRVTRGH